MKKICAVSGVEFEITDVDLAFYEKMRVPVPTLCPEERERRRIAFRNERHLYSRKCDATSKMIISNFSEKVPFPVYDQSYWWSDKWDPLTFGQNFDFSKSFFEQFQSLQNVVPRFNCSVNRSENCDYNNFCVDSKDSYLSQRVAGSENAYYSYLSIKNRDVTDCYNIADSELLYECVDCRTCYNGIFLQNCDNCSDCSFCKNCIGCNNCFGCVNLRNMQYCFLNKPLSKEEYEVKLVQLGLFQASKLSNTRKYFCEFAQKFPHKFMEGVQNQNVGGNYLSKCKNVYESYDCQNCEDQKHCWGHVSGKNSMDTSFNYHCENCYEFAAGTRNHELRFCFNILDGCCDLTYCIDCVNGSHDLFGCIGLKHAQYCIFNKQYSKEEYFKLQDKIIEHMKETGEWGEFFPVELSPFAYNETVAQEYFPLTKEEVLDRGWKWREIVKSEELRVKSFQIPDNITDVPDSICNETLACECCAKNYKIQKSELKFYRKMELSIPHKCPDCRHNDRMKLRNPRHLFSRNCDKCGIDIQTTFAPERPEKVYCEACYLDSLS